jgi:hypothetical protein
MAGDPGFQLPAAPCLSAFGLKSACRSGLRGYIGLACLVLLAAGRLGHRTCCPRARRVGPWRPLGYQLEKAKDQGDDRPGQAVLTGFSREDGHGAAAALPQYHGNPIVIGVQRLLEGLRGRPWRRPDRSPDPPASGHGQPPAAAAPLKTPSPPRPPEAASGAAESEPDPALRSNLSCRCGIQPEPSVAGLECPPSRFLSEFSAPTLGCRLRDVNQPFCLAYVKA